MNKQDRNELGARVADAIALENGVFRYPVIVLKAKEAQRKARIRGMH